MATTEAESYIGSDAGGTYVEWYREDDDGVGSVARWYGSCAQCEARKSQPPPPAREFCPLEETSGDDRSYDAGYAYACGYHD